MVDVAQLGVGFDTSGLKAGDAALDKTAATAGRTADAVGKVTTASGRMAQQVAAMVRQVEQAARAMEAVAAATEGEQRASAKAAQEVQRLGAALARQQGEARKAAQELASLRQRVDELSAAKSRAGNAAGGLGSSLGGLAGQIVGASLAAAGLAGGLAAAAAGIQSMIAAADGAQQAIGRLAANLGSLDTARQVYDRLVEGAIKTGSSASEAAQAFVRFDLAARSVGATRDETIRFTQTLQQLAVVAGTTTAEANAAFLQLAQGLASGRLQGDELRSVMEAMPQLGEMLAKSLNTSLGEIKRLGTEGKLTPDIIFRAVLQGQQEVEARFARMPLTVQRASGQMAAAFTELARRLDESIGLTPRLASALNALAGLATRAAEAVTPETTIERVRRLRSEVEQLMMTEEQRARQEEARRQADLRRMQEAAQRQQMGELRPPPRPPGGVAAPSQSDLDRRREELRLAQQQLELEGAYAAELYAAEAAQNKQNQTLAETARVKGLVKEATEALGTADDATKAQMDALRAVVAAGDDALRRYGISAEYAGNMLLGLQEKASPLLRVLADLNAQLRIAQAGGPQTAAGQIQGDLTRAAGGRRVEDALDPHEQAEVIAARTRLQEEEGRRALQAAQEQAAAARRVAEARRAGNRVAERTADVERQVQEAVDRYGPTFDAAAYRTTLLARAQDQAVQSGGRQTRSVAQVTRTLEAQARTAEAQARAWENGAAAVARATREERAHTEAIKADASQGARYNQVKAESLAFLEREANANARISALKERRDLSNEIALIERETQLLGQAPAIRSAELAILRARQTYLERGVELTDEEWAAIERGIRRREEAREQLRKTQQVYDDLARMAEEAFDRVGSAITEAFASGRIEAAKLRDIVKALISEIVQYLLKLAVLNPMLNATFGGSRTTLGDVGGVVGGGGFLGRMLGGGSGGAAAGGGAAGAAGGLDSLGGLGRMFGGGLSAWTQGGYQFSTGIGMADRVLNTPLFSTGAELYGPASAAAPTSAMGANFTLGQAGAGALGVLGGAYGLYSGIQTGGASGFAQGVGGVAGMAGGAAGLGLAAMGGVGTAATAGTAATGATALIGAGGAAALGAVAAVAPYIAIIAALVAAFLPGQKPGNGAAGAMLNLRSGQTDILRDGGGTQAQTREARDAIVRAMQQMTDQLAPLARVRPQGSVGFEVGTRDPSQLWYYGADGSRQHMGSAGVGQSQELVQAFEKALLTAYKNTPDMPQAQKWVFQSGGGLEQIVALLTRLDAVAKTYGEGALNTDRNSLSRSIVGAGHASGNIENVVAAIELAAQLTANLPKLVEDANALAVVARGGTDLQKIATDLQWLVDVYQPLSQAPKQVSALQASIDNLNATYDAAVVKARELGLSETELQKRRQEQITDLKKQARIGIGVAMRDATGNGAVDQLISLRQQADARIPDLDAAGISRSRGQALMVAQVKALIEGMDLETLQRVAATLNNVANEVLGRDFPGALLLVQQRVQELQAAARKDARATYDTAMRAAQGLGAVNEALNLRTQRDASAEAMRAAGRDPQALYAAQLKALFEGLDIDELKRAISALRPLDETATRMAEAALGMKEAAARQEEAARKAEEAAELQRRVTQAGGGIREYLDRLTSGAASQLSPRAQLQNAGRVFGRDLRLAGGGDMDALGRVTGSADAMLDAARALYGSGPQFQRVLQQVTQGLEALPAVQSYDQQILDTLKQIKEGITVQMVLDAEAALRLQIEAAVSAVRIGPASEAAKTRAEAILDDVKGVVSQLSVPTAATAAAALAARRALSAITGAVTAITLDPQVAEQTKLDALAIIGALVGYVEKIDASNASVAAKTQAQNVLAKIAGAVQKITISQDVRDATKAKANAILANIAGIVTAITIDPQVMAQVKVSAVNALSTIVGVVEKVTLAKDVTDATKRKALDALDDLKGRVTEITYAKGVTWRAKKAAHDALSTIAAAVGSIAISTKLTDAAKNKLLDTLGNLTATVTKIATSNAITDPTKNAILGYLDNLAAVVGVTANLDAVPAPLRNAITNSANVISRTLNLLASGGTLTADQRRHLDAELGTLDRTINQVLTGVGARALTEEQRAILMAHNGQVINRTINTDESVTTKVDNRHPLTKIFDRLLWLIDILRDNSDPDNPKEWLMLINGKMGTLNAHIKAIKDMAAWNGIGLKVMSKRREGPTFATFALGAAIDAGRVVNGPTVAPMALFGEAGPEAIMPLRRGPGGRLGVEATGGGERDDKALTDELRAANRELRAAVRVLSAGFTRLAEQNDEMRAEMADLKRRLDPDLRSPA